MHHRTSVTTNLGRRCPFELTSPKVPRCRYLRPASRGESGSVPHPDPEVRCWYLGRSQCRKCGVAGSTSGAALPNLGGGALQRLRRRCHGRHLLLLFSVAAGAAGWDCHCCYGWQLLVAPRGKVKAHLVALLYSFSIFSSRLQEGRPQGRSHIARGGAVNAGPTKSTDCSSDSGYFELETIATSSSSSRAKPKRKQDRGWNVRDDLGGRSIPSSIPADR